MAKPLPVIGFFRATVPERECRPLAAEARLMARRTRREAEATRESLLDAAEDCFREHGLFRTSLEAIATRAGVTRGAVYWHFKNKDEVLEAMINRVSVPFFHGLERVSRADGTTPLRDLRRMLCQSFADLVHDARVRSAVEVIELRSEVAVNDDAISRLRTHGMRETQARIAAAFRRAQALDQLRPGQVPDQCARSLHVVIAGSVRMHLLDPDTFDLERDGLAAVDLLLHAVADFPADEQVPEPACPAGTGGGTAKAGATAAAIGKPVSRTGRGPANGGPDPRPRRVGG